MYKTLNQTKGSKELKEYRQPHRSQTTFRHESTTNKDKHQ